MQQSQLNVPTAIIIAGVLIAGAILYGFMYMSPGTAAPDVKQQAAASKIPAASSDEHVLSGDPKTAKLTLVEYSDLECPFCSRFHPVLTQITAEYGSKVAWVYRQFPLSQIHPQALPAAIASECVASKKGNEAFKTFINYIFTNQQRIGTSLFHEAAAQVGISAADIDACIAAQESATKITDQTNDAIAAGGQGTPFTVILNQKGETVGIIPGALQYAQVKQQLDALLK
jgi:protein-disulfide isomerase